MNVLDLSSIRCPLALVLLKRELLKTDGFNNSSLKLIFSTELAMSDIILFLEKSLTYINRSDLNIHFH